MCSSNGMSDILSLVTITESLNRNIPDHLSNDVTVLTYRILF